MRRSRSVFLSDDAARGFATKNATQRVAVAANPLVDEFCNKDDPREPKEERDGDKQRQSHSNETNGSCSAMNLALGSDAMDGFGQRLGGKGRGNRGNHGVRERG